MSRGSNIGGPPKGWVDYHAVGRVIPYTRIVAFKTPLKREIHHARSDDPALDRFTPQDCIRAVRQSTGGRKQLRLVLNLTFTTKYYDPDEFEREGIHYGAIKCPGHEIPNDELFDAFQRSLYNFFWDYPDRNQVVGVHCTHGINRTGYMIARFLIQCEGWDVEEAICTVGDARGSPIERENYIAHLHNLHLPSYNFPKIPTAKDVKETAESEQKKNGNYSVSDSGNQLDPPVPVTMIVYAIVRWYFGFSWLHIVLSVSSGIGLSLTYGSMSSAARPVYSDSGTLVSAGTDLNMEGGITDYFKDLIIVTCAVMVLSLVSDYFWYGWLLIPAFALVKLWTSVISPWIFAPAPEVPEGASPQEGPRKGMRQTKQRKQGNSGSAGQSMSAFNYR